MIWSCSSTKYVPEDELLLKKNSIEINGSNSKNDKLNPYIIQKPNSKAIVFPLKLWFYNFGDKSYEKKWNDKIIKYKDSNHLFTKILSLKQTVGWANFNKDINKWVFKNGEEPVLLDTKKTKETLKTLKLYYLNEGFFKAKVAYKIDTLSSKKARVIYKIEKNNVFVIDSIKRQIASPIIDSLYKLHYEKTLIKKNKQFKTSNFEKEADRLTKIFRNAGVYHFSKYSINFREIDSTSSDYKTTVLVDIADRIVEENDSLVSYPYQISTIKKVKIYTDYSYFQRNDYLKDSIHFRNLNFYAYDKIKYKPHLLEQSIFIKPKQKYSDTNNELTRQNLRNLNNFKSIRINYEEVENNQLIAHILLTPSKQYGLKLESELAHSNIKPYAISGKLSLSNKNTFKRNEILQFGIQGSIINSTRIANDNNSFFNAWELGVDVSYKIPRFLIPFNQSKSFLKTITPKTTFTLGTSLQKNIGLDKQRFTAIAEYDWEITSKTKHRLEILNAQFIKNLNVNSFFSVYNSEYRKLVTIQNDNSDYFSNDLLENPLNFIAIALENTEFSQNNPEDYLKIQNIEKRYTIITEDVLVPAITYQFIYNTQSNYKDIDFSYFRAQIASSGLLSSLFAKNSVSNDPKQIFGTNIAQYFKLDLEFKKHWKLNFKNVLAYRTNIGIAIPYGNSTSIPFSRSYFVGGPNDIRAWRIYELGPGSENSRLEFNVGNLKLLSSIEYRFDIISSFKGALFIDAGNIWDTTNSDLTSDEAKFESFKSLQNIAIGSGFGIRYDFSFLVFRADLGFKTFEPYNINGEKWLQKSSLKKPILNIGINYPF